jgi:hypothetical protein
MCGRVTTWIGASLYACPLPTKLVIRVLMPETVRAARGGDVLDNGGKGNTRLTAGDYL